MEVSRTPTELCNWVHAKASELSATVEGRRYARSGAHLPKKLWEEIRPLGLFAQNIYGQQGGVRCTPNLTNDNYDGRIDFDDPSVPSIFVEVTYAKDGYDESLRLEVLTCSGSVNALGRTSRTGTKASGRRTIEVQNEFVGHNTTRDQAVKIVENRILSKGEKTYGPNHVLVVVVDDYIPFRTMDDKVVLEDFARSVIGNTKLDFGAVYLLGSSGNYLFRVADES